MGEGTVVEFGMVVDRRCKVGGQWDKKPVFVDVSFWGKRGEALERNLGKGDPIAVTGELDFSEWTDRETGKKRNKLRVVGIDWSFVPAPPEGNRREPSVGDVAKDAVGDIPF